MDKGFEVIDNFLSEEDHRRILDTMTSPYFPWYYNDQVAFKDPNWNPDTSLGNFFDEYYYFVHMFFYEHDVKSNFVSALKPLIDKINPKALIRVKGNLYTTLYRDAEDANHTDFPYPHKGAVYYVNTNNGKTIIDDGKEIHKIDSIANRILLFDPTVPHRSTHPTDVKKRININFNYF